ncbi:hypothetical protein AOC36_07050 [Erysipelothrix larvae]|uniref:Uncharacterized protein n=1 Tax=Erysipelothrix larvae TaxID=1514105 RepID=A0A0X8H0R4_9FIRM|nr:hypothetical protein [Erysipelothrix larvae]AMC93749.1 hypothetical protein AOC36_07050 [Erysipelothrix larvae]
METYYHELKRISGIQRIILGFITVGMIYALGMVDLYFMTQSLFLDCVMIGLLILKIVRNEKIPLLGYLMMFNKEVDQGTRLDHGLCFCFMGIYAIINGYYQSFDTLCTLPFAYLLVYYPIFSGITKSEGKTMFQK